MQPVYSFVRRTENPYAISQRVIALFTEPQSVTVAATPISLARVSTGDRSGIFENVASGLALRITHILGKRNRRAVRFDFTKTAADPLLDGVSRQYSMSVYLSADHPLVGFSATEVEDNIQAAVDWANTAGNLTKIVNGES